MSRNRTGVHVTAAPSGCGGCGHPYTLHSNGRTGCKAAGCTGGPTTACPSCHGTTMIVTANTDCDACGGSGVVPSPCRDFALHGHAHKVPELLAS